MRDGVRKRLERVEAGSSEEPLKIDMEALSEADLRVLASIPIVRGEAVIAIPPEAQALWDELEQVVVGRTVHLRRREPQEAH